MFANSAVHHFFIMTTRIPLALLALASIASAFVPSSMPPPSRGAALLAASRAGGEERGEVRRRLEFKDLGPVEETEARRLRLERDTAARARFETFGDGLWDLRSEMETLSQRLVSAIDRGEARAEEAARAALRSRERRDPELSYAVALAELEVARELGADADGLEKLRAKAAAARSCLPQFNLEGLWVGKYGSSYDLINITYVGDTLIAEKVTGVDSNVPAGAISFQADLHPLAQNPNALRSVVREDDALRPIVLTEEASKKWGTKKLPRYSGLGHVAEEGFKNSQWVDGQLIIIGDEYFSFAWLPIEQQIFFGRPSPELALRMLRDNGVSRVAERFDQPPSLDADLQVQKDFVTRCLEATHEHEDEFEGSASGCIWRDDEEECYFE